MAINRRQDQTNDQQLNLDINNGDLNALRTIREKLNLPDEEAVLRFALAVLSQAATDTVYIDDGTGAKVGLHPSDSLRRANTDGQGQQPAAGA